MSYSAAELEQPYEQPPIDEAIATSEPRQLPAARIAFVRFALVEIEALPEDMPLAT